MEISSQTAELSDSQRLLLAVKQATAKLQDIETAATEPIAIIGIGCRFPGGADSPETYWELLKEAKDVRTEIPKERWDIDRYYDPDPDVPGKIYVRQGYFLKHPVDQFDPAFFGISGAEAAKMDPSQRLLLEVSWEALENAGISPRSLKNTDTGVYVGQCFNDYATIGANSSPENLSDFHLGTGTAMNISAGRIAYILGLQGPTFCLDTTCSSSLVTLHLACQSLRSRECNLALVGGVNLMLHPNVTHGFCKGKALAPDSRCKTFDASADGYARGEGCGMIVVKRLRDAIADGDRILALVRGSAINHDGPSSGLTVPNQQAQKKVILQALKNAKLDPLDVGYVECHGTGTSLGDPLEVKALDQVYCQNRSEEQALVIGAVKSNIGHLEAAAGVAGLIKIILALQNQEIPGNLHFSEPNPRIDWDKIPVKVPTESLPWVNTEKGRIGAISGFGMSGTNAHVILSEAPLAAKTEDNLERPFNILTLSGRTEKALADLVGNYHSYLESHPELAIADVCSTANNGRTDFNHRLAVIIANKEELVKKLFRIKTGDADEVTGLFSGKLSNSSSSPKVAFLFTGQGSQYVNMGKQLYEQAPVFREALDQCDEILGGLNGKSLKEIIYSEATDNPDSSLLDQTAYTQPALFAIEYALAKLWQSWGIQPDVVMGHSVGEYVAATVAGVFSLADGLKLISARGQLMQQLPAGGAMLSVMASESKVVQVIKSYSEKVAIAAINGPESTVISGESEAIAAIATQLESEGIKTKKLQVSHAFHSQLMEPMLAEFEAVANQISYNQPRISIISNLTGAKADSSITTAKYWVNHVRQPVRFAQGMKTLQEQDIDILLEVGPKPVLLGMGRECLMGTKKLWLPSLRPGKQDWLQMLQSLGQLYVQGVKVDWLGVDKDYSSQKVILPTYPWQRRRYWITDLQQNSSHTPTAEKVQTNGHTEEPKIQTNGQKISQQSKFRLLDSNSVSFSQVALLKQPPKRKLAQLKVESMPAQPIKPIEQNIQIEKPVEFPVETIKENSKPQIISSDVDIAQIKSTLKQKLAEALYVDLSEIEEDQQFIDLGLDSIVGVEWITTINKTYDIDIKATKLYDYPTLLDLTEYIAQLLSSNGNINKVSQQIIPTKANENIPNQHQHLETPKPVNLPQKDLSEIKQLLKEKLAEALYLDLSEIEEDQQFIDLGLDSIVGVEWITTINKTYNIDIKATKLYDYPTLLDLAEYIGKEISAQSGQVSSKVNKPPVKEAPKKENLNSSKEDEMKQKLRSILNQVARNELTIQTANKMIQQLKQQAKI
ncbi:MAG: beta-ketoacyl synthase N-terminal-like domain-containing protein [Cyanobacteria bacterium P01_H01_bin.35]